LGYGNEHTPIMDEYYKKAISLPIYPNLDCKNLDYIIGNILNLLKKEN
jgi:dTDP-4-amino-4,6-dideoxygalactose transaminase